MLPRRRPVTPRVTLVSAVKTLAIAACGAPNVSPSNGDTGVGTARLRALTMSRSLFGTCWVAIAFPPAGAARVAIRGHGTRGALGDHRIRGLAAPSLAVLHGQYRGLAGGVGFQALEGRTMDAPPLRAARQGPQARLSLEARALVARGSYPKGPPVLRRREGAVEGRTSEEGGWTLTAGRPSSTVSSSS